MIVLITFLPFILSFGSCEAIRIDRSSQTRLRKWSENRHRGIPTLRINYGRQKNAAENYDHVSGDLLGFLQCVGDAPSHIPPMTIGKYKELVRFCLDSAQKLKNDSIKALVKEVPKEAKPVFKCFAEMDIKKEDDHQNAGEIIKCLNEGDPVRAAEILSNGKSYKYNISKPKSKEEFAKAFQNCILKSNHGTYEAKVMNCIDIFKNDENEFYKIFSPSYIRTQKGDLQMKEYDVRANNEQQPEILALIVVDDNNKNGKINRIYIPKPNQSDSKFYEID